MIKRYAVVGKPISHSLSPIIHEHFAKQAGIKLSYAKMIGDEVNFEQQINDFFASGGHGLNITHPFKQQAFSLATHMTTRCLAAKSANTLWLKDKKLWADNTDGVGLIQDLNRYIKLTDKNILILGAGGAARGIISPLLASNIAKLTVVNRSLAKLKALKEDFPQVHVDCLAHLEAEFDLIINATAVSLSETPLYFPETLLHNKPLGYDLTYNLQKATPFIKQLRDYHCQAVDGLGMLIEQAAAAFLVWHGVAPAVEEILSYLQRFRAN